MAFVMIENFKKCRLLPNKTEAINFAADETRLEQEKSVFTTAIIAASPPTQSNEPNPHHVLKNVERNFMHLTQTQIFPSCDHLMCSDQAFVDLKPTEHKPSSCHVHSAEYSKIPHEIY